MSKNENTLKYIKDIILAIIKAEKTPTGRINLIIALIALILAITTHVALTLFYTYVTISKLLDTIIIAMVLSTFSGIIAHLWEVGHEYHGRLP